MRRLGLFVVIALAAILTIIAGGLSGVPASSYQHGDFLQFWLQPRALVAAASPYDPVWWAAEHVQLGVAPLFPEAVYPPYDALFFAPFALLPLGYAAAAWLAVQVLLVAFTTVALARRIALPAHRAVAIAVVAGSQAAWLLVVGGNVTGFLFAALGAAYLAAVDRRPFRCGLFLGLLIVKPHPFVIVWLVALAFASRSERRAVIGGALTTSAPFVALTAVLHPSWYADWLPSALRLQDTAGSNATVWTAGRLFGASGPLIGAAGAVVLLALLAFLLLRARPSLGVALAAAIPVSIAVAPHGWSYDQLLLAIPLTLLIDRIGGRGVPARSLALAAIALGAVAVPWLLYTIAFRRGGEELSVITPIAAFAMIWFAVMPLYAGRTVIGGKRG